jgi:hypothetical protein
MPGGDRTGPMGEGPMTGGGFGYCGGYGMPGFAHPFPRRGFSRRWGRGRGLGWGPGMGRGYGWRHMAYATGMPGWQRYGYGPAWCPPAFAPYEPSAEEELAALKQQAQWLQEELQAISQRIGELEAEE